MQQDLFEKQEVVDSLNFDESPEGIIRDISAKTSDINIVSFSGGKDSSAVLQMVMSAMDAGQKLYIVTSDTLMEIPYFYEYLERVKDRIRDYIHWAGIDAEVVTVRPQPKDSFWVSVLGKGYPAAHMGFRWCTGKLKIDPITKFTKQVIDGHEYTVFIGVRRAESELRAKIYTRKDFKPHYYAPLLNWSSHDVWEFLLTNSCKWGDHSDLVTVYRYSSDECVYGEKQGVCIGNARYGCWACPLQREQQLTMIAAHTGDKRYEELRRFKKELVGTANRKAYRSRIRRDGSKGAGPFLVSVRKYLFENLKNLESRTGWQLITPEEENSIREHWAIDENVHDVPDDTAPMLWDI